MSIRRTSPHRTFTGRPRCQARIVRRAGPISTTTMAHSSTITRFPISVPCSTSTRTERRIGSTRHSAPVIITRFETCLVISCPATYRSGLRARLSRTCTIRLRNEATLSYKTAEDISANSCIMMIRMRDTSSSRRETESHIKSKCRKCTVIILSRPCQNRIPFSSTRTLSAATCGTRTRSSGMSGSCPRTTHMRPMPLRFSARDGSKTPRSSTETSLHRRATKR